jgi:hypothetical protein
MDNWTLFEFVKDAQKRHRIWQNILKVPTLIPSLYGLAEDKKFLCPLAKILKKIFVVAPDQTLRGALMSSFKDSERTDASPVQESESSTQLCAASPTQQLHWGIVQLFLFAGRHFPSLIAETPLKEHGRSKPEPRLPDMHIMVSFARTARDLGFDSEEIQRLITSDPDEDAAAMFLLQARKPPTYTYDERQFQQHKRNIRRILSTAHKATRSLSAPIFFVERGGESLERRCGRHWEQAYQYDRDYTFLPLFWRDNDDQGYGISSLFVRVAVYKAFFGNLIYDDMIPPWTTMFSPSQGKPGEDCEISSEKSLESPESHGDEEMEDTSFLRTEVARLALEADQLRAAIQEERAVAAEAKNDMEKHVERQLQDCQSTNRSLLAQKDELSRRLTQREGESLRLNAEISDLRDRLNTTSQNVQSVSLRLEKADQENKSLQLQLEKTSKDVDMSSEEQEQDNDMDEDSTRLVETIVDQLHSLEQDIVLVQHDLEQINGMTSIEPTPVSWSGTSDLQIAKATNGMDALSNAETKMLTLNQKLQEVLEAKVKTRQKWDHLKPSIRTLCTSFEALRLQAESAKQAYNEERNRIRKENSDLTEAIKNANYDKEQMQKHGNDLMSQVQIQSQQIEERESMLVSMQQKGLELQQEIQDLREQLRDLRSEPQRKALPRRDERVKKRSDRAGENTRRKALQATDAQTRQQSEIEPGLHTSEQRSPPDGKALIRFQLETDTEPFKEVTLNQQRLKRILEECKKNQLVLCDTNTKAMMPEDTWGIITTNGTLTVVLHSQEGHSSGKSLVRTGKRKQPQGQNQLVLDLNSRSHEASRILQDILDNDEMMEI